MIRLTRSYRTYLIVFLCLATIVIWSLVYEAKLKDIDYVTVSFLDVGQGDSILIEGRTGNQVLIDSGSGKAVLRRLSEELSFFDKSINILIGTHPDKDHIGGFPYILERYNVSNFIEPGVESKNGIDDEIRRIRTKKNIPSTIARAGNIIDFHDGSYLRFLFPDQDVEVWNTNDASIVAQYIYGETCFMFTGDSSVKIEDYLIYIYGENLKCQVLKVGHHGSRTSTGDNYLEMVTPEIAVISAGKDNSYGHPHKEVMDKLIKNNIKVLSTIDLGTITLYSDGKKIWKK